MEDALKLCPTGRSLMKQATEEWWLAIKSGDQDERRRAEYYQQLWERHLGACSTCNPAEGE